MVRLVGTGAYPKMDKWRKFARPRSASSLQQSSPEVNSKHTNIRAVHFNNQYITEISSRADILLSCVAQELISHKELTAAVSEYVNTMPGAAAALLKELGVAQEQVNSTFNNSDLHHFLNC